MARFVKKGTGKSAVFEIDTEASTSPNPHGTAEKAVAAKRAEVEQSKEKDAEGAK